MRTTTGLMLVGGAAAQDGGNPYYSALGHMWTYNVSYMLVEGSMCDGEALTGDPIAGDRAACEAECDANPACYGFNLMATECTLMSSDCQTKLIRGLLVGSGATGANYVAKMDPESRSGELGCPLGQSILVSGLEQQYTAQHGYESEGRYSAPSGVRVSWSHTGCGWVLDRPVVGSDCVATTPELQCADCDLSPGSTCCDDVDAANFLFCQTHLDIAGGNPRDVIRDHPQYDPHICTTVQPWLEDGYCENAVFAAVCSHACEVQCETCRSWEFDNTGAACLIAKMLGLVPAEEDCNAGTICSTLQAQQMCSHDLVVQRVCPRTCAMPVDNRRLQAAGGGNFTTSSLTRSFKQMLEQTARTRRLGVDASVAASPRLEVAATWDDTDDLAKAQLECPADRSAEVTNGFLPISGCYHLENFHCAVESERGDFMITKDCTMQETYMTHSERYCEDNNIDISDATTTGAMQPPGAMLPDVCAGDCTAEQWAAIQAAVAAETCYQKCHSPDATEQYSQPGPDAHCEGTDPAFNVHSNALCVTRERCEVLCNMLGDGCGGIEVHRTRPRCYLNTPTCRDNPDALRTVENPQYDFAEKTTAMVSFQTFSFRECLPAGQYAPITAPILRGWLSTSGGDIGSWFAKYQQFTCFGRCKCGGCALDGECGDGNTCDLGICSNCLAAQSPECNGMEVADLEESGSFCVDRELCEFLCTDSPNCAGFKMFKGRNRCELFDSTERNVNGGYCPPDSEISDYPSASWSFDPSNGDWVFDGVASDYVLKREIIPDRDEDGAYDPERYNFPCAARVSGHPAGAEFDGNYEKQRADSDSCAFAAGGASAFECYHHRTAGARLVWANQEQFTHYVDADGAPQPSVRASYCGDTPRVGAGWIMQHDVAGVYTSDYVTFPNGTCPTVPTGIADAEAFLPDSIGELFRFRPEYRENCAVDFLCNEYPHCPELTTCVLAKGRFADELAVIRAPYARDAVVPEEATICEDRGFHPKVLSSVERAEAFIASAKWQWAQEIYRNIPGAVRVTVRSPGSADKLMISLASSYLDFLAGEFIPADATEHPLPVPDGHDQWYTDVIRVQAFNSTCHYASNLDLHLDIHAAGAPHLRCYGLLFGAADMMEVPVTDAGNGVFTVEIQEQGHYACTTESRCEDPDPAAFSNVESFEGVGNDAGAMREPICASGYTMQNTLTCSLGVFQVVNSETTEVCVEEPYVPETHYFRLTHCARMDYGWRIREIEVFSDDQCTTPIVGTDGSAVVIAESDATLGEEPVPHYPDATIQGVDQTFLAANARDAAMETEFWSKCLNCNPYPVDETHGSAVVVDFAVESPDPVDVQCVKVTSRATDSSSPPKDKQYFPCCVKLFRGWKKYGADAATKVEPAATHVMGWTEHWTMEYTKDKEDVTTVPSYVFKSDAADERCDPAALEEGQSCSSVASFVTICGQRNLHIFGELLSFQRDVPSSCHCKQLCIDKIEDGCRSWKYNTQTLTCFLQLDIKTVEGGDCDDVTAKWISGDTGLRLTGLAREIVEPDMNFDLTVTGINLPTEPDLYDSTAARQRVKIIEDRPGASCADDPQPAVVSGIGCSKPYLCAPKPSSTSKTHATWSNIRITSTSESKTYIVCYNRGFTYDRYSWHRVPAMLHVERAPFAWTLTLPMGHTMLTRKTPSIDLTITRPSFSSYSDAADWRLKVVKAGLRCSEVEFTDAKVLFQDTGITQTNADSGAADSFPDPDSATWSTIRLFDQDAGLAATDVEQNYTICFNDRAGTTAFRPIPEANGGRILLTIAREEGDFTHQRTVFSNLMLSGRAGQSNSLTLAGFHLHLPSTDAIAFVKRSAGVACGAATAAHFEFGTAHGSVQVDEDASSSEGYTFQVSIPASARPGYYDICYCDDQAAFNADAGRDVAAADESPAYSIQEHRALTVAGAMAVGTWDASYQPFQCYARCSRGCSGRGCYCDAFDPDTMDATSKHLCLPPTQCRDACDATTGCRHFSAHGDSNLCLLGGAGAATSRDDDATLFSQYLSGAGTRQVVCRAATGAASFSRNVGTLVVTRRPHVGVDWVLRPETRQSIEVLGADLDFLKDRIMVVDCQGVCGVSGPTQALTVPNLSTEPTAACCDSKPPTRSSLEATAMAFFNTWVPVNAFDDAPSNNTEPGYVPPAAGGDQQAYTVATASYCPANNIDITTVTTGDANLHQCYSKCTLNAPCEGDDCFCDGHYVGYDDAASTALCLSMERCQALCLEVEGCYGIDMHASMPRCFLNTVDCEALVPDGLNADASYNFYYKVDVARRLAAPARGPVLAATPARRLLASSDVGYSWSEILRYRYIQFRSGGTFKVCFCDKDVMAELGAGRVCSGAEDYAVDVGTVHVSGVSCLVSMRRFQRGICCSQWWGGLRCYPDTCPSITVPVEADGSTNLPPMIVTPDQTPEEQEQTITTWCLYGPEDVTSLDANCAALRVQ
mmetsp:Transcript_22297/g.56829  ORF Transcript_22297/g.56829 Transcript_22297/m.56829 type:complete len:2447 (+) Transcript_22297:85-7425(+)